MSGDVRRPYPTDMDMRSGLLGRMSDLPGASASRLSDLPGAGGAAQQHQFSTDPMAAARGTLGENSYTHAGFITEMGLS